MNTEQSQGKTQEVLKILRNLPGFQQNVSDPLIVEMLSEEFPNVDLSEEAKKYLSFGLLISRKRKL